MPSLAILPPLVLVMLGGAIGAALRFLAGRWAAVALPPGLPWATWSVNLAGGFAMGLLAGWLARTDAAQEPLRLLLGIGLLGGFTTFSAFSLELFNMLVRGEAGLAAAYAVSSVAGSILALYAGVLVMRA